MSTSAAQLPDVCSERFCRFHGRFVPANVGVHAAGRVAQHPGKKGHYRLWVPSGSPGSVWTCAMPAYHPWMAVDRIDRISSGMNIHKSRHRSIWTTGIYRGILEITTLRYWMSLVRDWLKHLKTHSANGITVMIRKKVVKHGGPATPTVNTRPVPPRPGNSSKYCWIFQPWKIIGAPSHGAWEWYLHPWTSKNQRWQMGKTHLRRTFRLPRLPEGSFSWSTV